VVAIAIPIDCVAQTDGGRNVVPEIDGSCEAQDDWRPSPTFKNWACDKLGTDCGAQLTISIVIATRSDALQAAIRAHDSSTDWRELHRTTTGTSCDKAAENAIALLKAAIEDWRAQRSAWEQPSSELEGPKGHMHLNMRGSGSSPEANAEWPAIAPRSRPAWGKLFGAVQADLASWLFTAPVLAPGAAFGGQVGLRRFNLVADVRISLAYLATPQRYGVAGARWNWAVVREEACVGSFLDASPYGWLLEGCVTFDVGVVRSSTSTLVNNGSAQNWWLAPGLGPRLARKLWGNLWVQMAPGIVAPLRRYRYHYYQAAFPALDDRTVYRSPEFGITVDLGVAYRFM
jgi:hypothetical protein